jgi:hypothetical protein
VCSGFDQGVRRETGQKRVAAFVQIRCLELMHVNKFSDSLRMTFVSEGRSILR